MRLFNNLASRVIELSDRFPWAIPLFGFVSGVASFVLVERNQELAQYIALMILVSWCWLSVEKGLHKLVKHWLGFRLPRPLLAYAAQLVHQESLFFVITFFFITTTWDSGQAIFTSLLIIAAVISIIDPLYFRWLVPRRSWYFIFHGITFFAVLLTVLPIIFHLTTAKSFFWSLSISLFATLFAMVGESSWPWWRRLASILLLAASLGVAGYLLRPWIPPATLWLTQVAITNVIDDENRSPANHFTRLSQDELQKGIYAYTAIHAPRGLNERIYHIWQLNGREVDRVPLDISGGREAGYRAWTHKVNFPENSIGDWQIRVVTGTNQLIGILHFTVTKNATSTATETVELLSPDDVIKAPLRDMVK